MADKASGIAGASFVLSFGKYKGKMLLDIVKENPSYILWLEENVTTIPHIDKDLLQYAEDDVRQDEAESEAMIPENWR